MMIPHRLIHNFWIFFEKIESRIIYNPNDEKTIELIDNEVNKLGEISWEYGPFENGYYFSLSPNLKPDLIEFVNVAISFAPVLPNWKFIAGKPQKLERINEFTMINNDHTESIIRTKNWNAVVYKYKDGIYDIDIKTDLNFDENTNYLAVEIALTNLLGEINFITKVNSINIVNHFDSNTNNIGIKFNDLSKIIL